RPKRFCDDIGVQDQNISGRKADFGGGELLVAEESHRHSGGLDAIYATHAYVQWRKVSAIAKFHFTAGFCSSANQGGVLSRQSALTENAIGPLHQLLQRKP